MSVLLRFTPFYYGLTTTLVTLSTVALFSLPAFAENANMPYIEQIQPSTQPSTQPYYGRIINDCNTCDSTGQYCTQIGCPEPYRSSRRNINHRRHKITINYFSLVGWVEAFHPITQPNTARFGSKMLWRGELVNC